MISEFKNVIFPLIETFKKEGGLEWTDLLKDLDQEDLVDTLETIHETVKNVIYHASLLPDIDEKEREKIIGKLAIRAAHLFHAPGRYGPPQLKEAIQSFEHALQDIIRQDWINQARERYDEFEKIYEEAEKEGEISPKDVDYLRPVFFALDLFEIITYEPSSDETEYEEEMFELEEDDEENDEENDEE